MCSSALSRFLFSSDDTEKKGCPLLSSCHAVNLVTCWFRMYILYSLGAGIVICWGYPNSVHKLLAFPCCPYIVIWVSWGANPIFIKPWSSSPLSSWMMHLEKWNTRILMTCCKHMAFYCPFLASSGAPTPTHYNSFLLAPTSMLHVCYQFFTEWRTFIKADISILNWFSLASWNIQMYELIFIEIFKTFSYQHTT